MTLTRNWLNDQIAAMAEDEDEIAPDDSLILFGLDSIRVMEFIGTLEEQGIKVSFEELISKPTPNAWWALIEARTPAHQPG